MRLGGIASIVMVCAVLVGCAPAVAAPPTSRPTPEATPTPTHDPESPEQSAPGVPRLALGCEEVQALAETSALVESSPVAIDFAAEYPYGTVATYRLAKRAALLTVGGVHCFWKPAGGDMELRLEMLPVDEGWVPEGEEISGSAAWSDDARGYCSSYTDIGCDYAFRVGDVAVRIEAMAWGQGESALESLRQRTNAFAAAVSARIRTLPTPGAVWRGARIAAPGDCAAWGVDGTSVGANSGLEPAPLPQDVPSPLVDAAFVEAGALECGWAGSDGGGVLVLIVPASSWMWEVDPPRGNGSLELIPITGVGDRALIGGDGAYLHVLIGDAWLYIQGSRMDQAAAIEFADRLLARL